MILHAGSGPTDRDGNGPLVRTDNLKMLGRALAAEGIAVLRIDKRGVGASAKALAKEEDVRLETYAADVAAWAARLRKDPRFTKVGFIGHSEGALIGLIAAKDAKLDAYVSLCGPGRPLQEVLREQLKKNLPKDLYKASDTIIAELEAGRTVKDVPKGLAVAVPPERAAVPDLDVQARPGEAGRGVRRAGAGGVRFDRHPGVGRRTRSGWARRTRRRRSSPSTG